MPNDAARKGWKFFLGDWKISVFLLVPASAVFHYAGFSPVLAFAVSALALVPLAALLGSATEELAGRFGPAAGGLINATFGNATEIILGFVLLWRGHPEVVKATLTGSIIGNLLLVFGLSIIVGGWGREKQTFSRISAGASTAMLFLAVVGLVMPAVYDLSVFQSLEPSGKTIETLSLWTAAILLISYAGGMLFTFRTHRNLFGRADSEPPRVSAAAAGIAVAAVSILIAFESELLAGQIRAATHALGWTESFIGLVILATVGNAAEHSSAVMAARKNKMDLALSIAMGSSTQIALLVAPLLVLVSQFLARPMSLVFAPLEIVAVVFSVAVVTLVSFDGETNWFEGLQLLSVYAILAVFFFFMPAA